MAKTEPTKKQRETIRQLRDTKQKYLRNSAIGISVALVCIGVQFLLMSFEVIDPSNPLLDSVTYALYFVYAAIVGVSTYRWSKASQAYKDYLAQHNVIDVDA